MESEFSTVTLSGDCRETVWVAVKQYPSTGAIIIINYNVL